VGTPEPVQGAGGGEDGGPAGGAPERRADGGAEGGSLREDGGASTAEGAGGVVAGTAVVAYGSPFSREEIASVVGRHLPDIQRCYERARVADPDLEGRVVMAWTIAADGSVEAARVETSTLGNAGAERCIVGVVGRLRFTPRIRGTGGIVQIRYPFVFRDDPSD